MNLISLKVLYKVDPEDGLAEWESGRITVFNQSVWNTAELIATEYYKTKIPYISSYTRAIQKDLFDLTVFHELYHAGNFEHGEQKADDFAWKAFKLMYKRSPCFPKKYWRNLP